MSIELKLTAATVADLRAQLVALLSPGAPLPSPNLEAVGPATAALDSDVNLFDQSQNETATGTDPDQTATNGSGEPQDAPGTRSAPRGSGRQGNVSSKAQKSAGAPSKAANTPKLQKSDVLRALTSYLALNDEPSTAKLLKKFGGVSKLSDLPEEKYQAVYDAASVP